MNEAQKFLVENNLDDIVLNAKQYPENTPENANKWIYLSDVLQQFVSGSWQDIQEVIELLQWVFRKIDKGDTPEETVRMLLMNRDKIDNIKFDSNEHKKTN